VSDAVKLSREADWSDMLRARPTRNTAARAVENGPRGVTIYVRRRRPAWLVAPVSWVVPYAPEREVVLDALGRQVWQWCDGALTVEDIVERFKDEHRLTFHEARAAVTGYLRQLIQRGVLAIVMRDPS
jgi:hypothetical protein